MGTALGYLHSNDWGTATNARQSGTPEYFDILLVPTGFPIRKRKIGFSMTQTGAQIFNTTLQNFLDGRQKTLAVGFIQQPGPGCWMNASGKQGLIRIYISDSGNACLIQQKGFNCCASAGDQAHQCFEGKIFRQRFYPKSAVQ